MDNVHRFAGDCRIGKVPQRQYKLEIISKVKGEKSLGVSNGFQSRRTEMYVRGKPHLMQGRVPREIEGSAAIIRPFMV